jgi:hypothetical protein
MNCRNPTVSHRINASFSVKSLSFFILGLIIGVLGYHYYLQRSPAVPAEVRAPAERARAGAREVTDRVVDKLSDWNLNPDDIKRDLAAGGRVIRDKAQVAGARIDDDRIVSVIKARYVLDDGLKALDINVDCRDGHVTLRGQVPDHAAIARAVSLALETDGVVKVEAELTPAPSS